MHHVWGRRVFPWVVSICLIGGCSFSAWYIAQGELQTPHTWCTAHTVHLGLGALLSPCAMCGTGEFRGDSIYVVAWVQSLSISFAQGWLLQDVLVISRAAHGALPHRAPCTRCAAESVHRVWLQVIIVRNNIKYTKKSIRSHRY